MPAHDSKPPVRRIQPLAILYLARIAESVERDTSSAVHSPAASVVSGERHRPIDGDAHVAERADRITPRLCRGNERECGGRGA